MWRHVSVSPVTRLSATFVLALVLTLYTTGCDDQPSMQSPSGGVEPQAGAIGGAQGGSMAGLSSGGEAGELAGELGGVPTEARCDWPADCPEGDCSEGRCVEALGSCRLNLQCPDRSVCLEERCIAACTYDSDCAQGGMCIEGVCMPSPPQLNEGEPLPALSSEGELLVGVGLSDFDYPVGVSLAGFGTRPGPRNPYTRSLGGSHSVWERQDVRAVALDSAGQVTLLVRLPLAWSTDYLRSLIALELSALLSAEGDDGINPLDELLIFATHSHSQPARFWNLVPNLNFGTLGYGSFSPSLTRAYARSAALAAHRALRARVPARLGWSLLDEADPERLIHSNRRGHANDILDDRLLALRFDDMSGAPLAAFVGFGVHGTHLMTPLVTGDAAGAIERHFTERLSARYERFVPAIFMNGNAGNISPRGDHVSSEGLGHLQALAALLWERYEPLFEGVRWEDSPEVKHKAWRVPVGYEVLGYGEDELPFLSLTDEPLYYGGFYCAPDERAPEEPSYEREELPCALVIHDIYHAPILQLQKTVLSALRLGSLILTTMPGEPSSELGLRVGELVEEDALRAGLNEPRSFNIGYAQDHHFYLLRSEDWLRGGYETQMGLWGWREGEHLIEQASALSAHLLGLTELPDYGLAPTWWPLEQLEDDLRLPSPSSASLELLEQVSGTVSRGELAQLSWRGGDPAVDRPRVSLWSVAEGEELSPTLHPESGLPINDEGLESVIKYEGDYEGEHRWSLALDLPLSLPVGRYLLKVTGQAEEPYALEGEPFTLSGRGGLLLHHREDSGEDLTLDLSYAHAPSSDLGGVFMGRAATGSLLRLLSPLSRDSESLSRSTRELRDWRYLIGPPPLTALQLTAYAPGVELDERGRSETSALLSRELIPTRAECAVELVTSRDVEGVEELQQITGRLCGRVVLSSAELLSAGLSAGSGAQLVLHDSAGSWSALNY